MYFTTTVIPDLGDVPNCYLNPSDRGPIPVIVLENLTIQLPTRMSPAEQAAWLRDLSAKVASLAEAIEAANVEQVTQ